LHVSSSRDSARVLSRRLHKQGCTKQELEKAQRETADETDAAQAAAAAVQEAADIVLAETQARLAAAQVCLQCAVGLHSGQAHCGRCRLMTPHLRAIPRCPKLEHRCCVC